jgi:hypothetical protein
MNRDERKRHKKRRREEKREARNLRHIAAKAVDVFPKIVINPKGGDAALVRHMEKIVASLDLSDTDVLSLDGQDFLKFIRREGKRGVEMLVHRDTKHSDDPYRLNRITFMVELAIGDWIFERLPTAYQQIPLAIQYFKVQVVDRTIEILFDSLPSKPHEKGRVFYPSHDPKAVFDGNPFPVGFSRHAIERACERMIWMKPLDYAQLLLIRLQLTGCLTCEGLQLSNGQPAFAMYGSVGDPGNPIYETYVDRILNTTPGIPAERLRYLMGYCPVDFRLGRAVAITFLPPGYSGTPEDQLVRSTVTDRGLQRQLLAAARNNTFGQVLIGNHEVIKWYHENGVPQVKLIPPGKMG